MTDDPADDTEEQLPEDTAAPPTEEPTPGERVQSGQQPAREGAVPQVTEQGAQILEPEGSDTAPTAGGSRAGGGT